MKMFVALGVLLMIVGVTASLAGLPEAASLRAPISSLDHGSPASLSCPATRTAIAAPASNAKNHGSPASPSYPATWNAIAAPASNADRLTSATVYDPVGDMFYMIGGCAAGVAGTQLASNYRYNPTTNAWDTMAAMPTPRGWLKGTYVRGKIYIIGGYSNSSTALNTNEEYTIASNTWATKAVKPTAVLAHEEVAWRDSLIFELGGYNGSTGINTVEIYNPFTDSWATGTSLPNPFDMGGAAIIGDTIYIVGGLNRPANAAYTNVIVGAINPANPTSITWTTGAALPTPNCINGTAALNGKVYMLGGFLNLTTVTNQLQQFDPATNIFTALDVYPVTIARNHYLSARPSEGALYVFAGDANGDWAAPNNYYYKYNLTTYSHDVGVTAILSPVANETPNSVVTPVVVYMNQGTSPETNITVGCFVDSSGTRIYSDSSLIASMAAGDTASISYPNWTVGPSGATYTFVGWNRLAGDVNAVNDTMKLTVTAFPMLTTLVAPKGTAPTIDGVINTAEWADAYKYDISDVLGNGGGDAGGVPPGSCYMYLKNDSANLYVAVDDNVGSSADYDQIGLYFDDNYDRAWASDSSEGNFWWAYVAAGNRTIYRSIPDYTMTEPVPGMTWAISTSSGHQQYEGLVQIGLKPPNPNYFLNSVVGDTVGFYTYSQFNGVVQRGWWPQAMPNSAWNDCSQYGSLVLSPNLSGVESQPVIKRPVSVALFASAPNPTKGNATISYSIPAQSEVSLKVYDATGRLVRTLASGTREAGVHSVTLDGRGLGSGVYFYRLQAGNFTATKKLVIAH